MDNNKQTNVKQYTREEQLAIVKASNEMLAQAYSKLKDRGTSDDVLKGVETSIQENLKYAEEQLHATKRDVDDARYHGASIAEIKKYEERLKRKGITDEQLRRKDIATTSATAEPSSGEKKPRRTRVKKEETEKPIQQQEGEKPKKRRQRGTKVVVEEEYKPDGYIEEYKQEPVVVEPKKDEQTSGKLTDNMTNYGVEQFNLDEIPDYVQYDIIPLPSNGQCYPHKKGRIPVAYLTAADENLIASPNMYRDGKLLDVILRRKVLDKTINVDDLCVGDRDAIILWLRATAYGDDFPISARDPETGKEYETTVKLSSLNMKKLEIEGDENGLLTYRIGKNILKFRYPSKTKENQLRETLLNDLKNYNTSLALESLTRLRADIGRVDLSEENRTMCEEDLGEMFDIIMENEAKQVDTDVYPGTVTEQMILHTISVNGNTDPDYIRRFIENMRSGDALAYRSFINKNKPGVDFRITVNIPESDGGGSFDTFLRLDDSVFLHIDVREGD